MKWIGLTYLALALACSRGAASREVAKVTPVEQKAPQHQFIAQPAVESPPAVINAAGDTIIHADPSELFKGVIKDDHPVRFDDLGFAYPTEAQQLGGIGGACAAGGL